MRDLVRRLAGIAVLLVGIVVVLLTLDFRLGLLTLSTMPILFIVRIFWLPPAKRAFWAAHETNSLTAGAMAEGPAERIFESQP